MKILRVLMVSVVIGMVSIFASIATYAANGDIMQPIYGTDITTNVDGIPIQGYNIGGSTLICLEDLANYGFSIYYNNEARCLFVNKQGYADKNFKPVIKRESIGNIIGYTYETDIKAILNGEEISAQSIGGRLVVAVETLDDLKDSFLSSIASVKNYPKYFMMQTYNDSARVLNVYSNIEIGGLYDKNVQNFTEEIARQKDNAAEIVNTYTCDSFTQYIYRVPSQEYLPNYRSLAVVRFYKSGRILDYTNALFAYSFISISAAGTSLRENVNFTDDGSHLIIFNNFRSQLEINSLMGHTHTFESGDYKLDLNTCELIKVKTVFYGYIDEVRIV